MNQNEPSALRRAVGAGERAATYGFDWAHAADAIDKVSEEVEELREAMAGESEADIVEELGDLYFAVSNVARKLGVDPEATLNAAIEKFEHRFQAVLDAAGALGRDPRDMSLDELESLWLIAKREQA